MKFCEDNYIYFQKTGRIICKFNIEALLFRDFYRFFLPFHHIFSYLISSNHKRRTMNNKLESLTPEQFTEPMQKHLAVLEQVLKEKQGAAKHAPSDSIRIVKNHGCFQFYKRKSKRDAQGIYMPRAQNSLALKLIQNDYDTKAINSLHEEISLLKVFLKKYKINNTTHLYEKLTSSRRKLITPLTLPDERFAKNWLATEYKKKQIPEDAPKLFTDNGEQVRSKSEVIIANSLKAAGIPYRYEFPLTLNRRAEIAKTSRSSDLCTFHPDFYCLNLRSRKEFIWEHFGMMDDAEYAIHAGEKLLLYQQNGYLPGRNLIITMETSRAPFSSRAAKQIIEEYLIS